MLLLVIIKLLCWMVVLICLKQRMTYLGGNDGVSSSPWVRVRFQCGGVTCGRRDAISREGRRRDNFRVRGWEKKRETRIICDPIYNVWVRFDQNSMYRSFVFCPSTYLNTFRPRLLPKLSIVKPELELFIQVMPLFT